MQFKNILKYLNSVSLGIINTNLEGIYIGENMEFNSPDDYLTVYDENTCQISNVFSKEYIILKEGATEKSAIEISGLLKKFQGAVAAGSGTVCDVVKRASFLVEKPFIIYATALSMNGYASSTSSLIKDGIKSSFKSKIAKEIYFDLHVVKNAPTKLIKAGFADVMARFSAENDCILSYLHKGIPYEKKLFDIRRSSEEILIKNYKKIFDNENNFLLALIENIILSGAAMDAFGSSVPASGGEHALVHVYESIFPLKSKDFLHGEMVSGFTLEMLKIQEQNFSSIASDAKSVIFQKGFSLLNKIYSELSLPTGFKDYHLKETEFEDIKKQAALLRERYGFLNL